MARLWLASGVLAAACAAGAAEPPREVSFPTADGGRIHALLYGDGDHAVVLAHGKVFNKESWSPLAKTLAQRGLRVLAIDFRGYGKSTAGSEPRALYRDVLGAIDYLRKEGASRISLLGASMGGAAVSAAAGAIEEGEVDRVVLLAPAPLAVAEEMVGSKLLIVSRDEPLAPRLRERFRSVRDPKRVVVLPGRAHAQHVFETEHGELLANLVVEFLLEAPTSN